MPGVGYLLETGLIDSIFMITFNKKHLIYIGIHIFRQSFLLEWNKRLKYFCRYKLMCQVRQLRPVVLLLVEFFPKLHM